jgi:hypothetical protein
MFVGMTCFAVAFGLYVYLEPVDWHWGEMPLGLPFGLFRVWTYGAIIGAGCGSLFGRFWMGSLMGAALSMPGVAALMILNTN